MRIGIFNGSVNEGSVDQMVAEAQQAEADGFDTFWVPQIFGHDALTALGVVAHQTSTIKLGTSVVPTYPRHPMALAQQALTVDAIAGGRLTLGIGLSHQPVVEGMWGMSFDKPVRHMREFLEALNPFLADQRGFVKGEVFTARGELSIRFEHQPGVVIAALGEQMLRVAAQHSDGTLTWCTGPKTLADHTVPTLRRAAEEAGRDATRVIAALPVCVTDDVASAQARAASVFEIYGQLPSYRAMLDREGASGPADIVVAGSADECANRIGALADIGVTDFAGVEFSTDPDEAGATRAMLASLL